MSSLARRYRSGGADRPDPGVLMPPNLRTLAVAPFGDPQRARLLAWLGEAAWPREHMEIAMLEGYLVALIAWPVDISSGAWLPPIWGERGWKVPTKIAARSQYEEFVALIVGFMQDLDRKLSTRPSRFESSVLHGLKEGARIEALHGWGKGFMTALTLGSQGLKWRSASASVAVRAIAGSTSASAPFGPHAIEEVVNAVMALMEQRASRGPLGPLEVAAPVDSPIRRATLAEPAANSRNVAKRPD
ncbi:MAG: YecA family protein [Pseudomonadota bacterium]